jgi:hypothetical protein
MKIEATTNPTLAELAQATPEQRRQFAEAAWQRTLRQKQQAGSPTARHFCSRRKLSNPTPFELRQNPQLGSFIRTAKWQDDVEDRNRRRWEKQEALRDAAQAEWLAFNGVAMHEPIDAWKAKFARLYIPFNVKLEPVTNPLPLTSKQALGPLPNHPELTAQQAKALDDYWAHIPSGKMIFERTGELHNAASVDKHIGRIKDAMKTEGQGVQASTWLSQKRFVNSIGWAPGEPKIIDDKVLTKDGWIPVAGKRTFNSYLPPTIKHIAGDVSLWLKHIKAIYPEEWQHIVKWSAFRVQHPDEKINHALDLIGPMGIGKDTIILPVIKAIGEWNFKEITAPEFYTSEWNDYLQSVILRINEIHDLGGESRYGFYERTKDIITNPPGTHRINTKHVPQYVALNVCGVIMTSNHLDALYIPPDDRRHYVCVSTRTKEEFSKEYWDAIYGWFRNGGFEAIAHYLATFDLSGFDAKSPPPKTAGWYAAMGAGVAPETGDLLDVIEGMGTPPAVTLSMIKARAPIESELRAAFNDAKGRKRLPKRMDDAGYVAVPNPDAQKDGRWRTNTEGRAVIYGSKTLGDNERLAAARKLAAMKAPPALPSPPSPER